MQTQAPLRSTDIMVVDGYQQTREILTELFELSGYEVSTAKDGAEALRQMSEHLIPVVIIDEDLADFSGPTLSTRLKSRAGEAWQGARCITIAVRGDATQRIDAAWKDFDYVMPKPLDYERFDVLVAKVCLNVERSPTGS